MMKNKYEIDMCNGPLVSKMLLFSIPLILSSILQLLFNAADIVVVGRFAGSISLAAVGATTVLIHLCVNFFIGFSIGANVLAAQFYGAGDGKNTHETVHTAILLAIISGMVLIVVGIFMPGIMLKAMGTPEEVLPLATRYLQIYFLGMPAVMVYNFGAAILRAVGDTRRPLYYLTTAGIVNVVLNLFFVIVCGLGVVGVAMATAISQYISAVLIIRCMMKMDSLCRLELKGLKIYGNKLKGIVKIGLPAGLQGVLFSISNILIQSSINSFGAIAMAGNSTSSNIEGFVYVSMNAIYQTNLSFTSQNVGAGKYKRITPILIRSIGIVICVGMLLGWSAVFFHNQLLGLYSSDPEVLAYAYDRLRIICGCYMLCGIMDVMVGSLRGMGYSVVPMIVTLTGVCGLRILWIFTVFVAHPSLKLLYISYPLTWIFTEIAHLICYIVIKRKKFSVPRCA